MTPVALARVLRGKLARGPRQVWWATARLAGEVAATRSRAPAGFRQHALADELRYLSGSVQPVAGDNERRAHAAAGWLLRAQEAAGDGGASYGYFPCLGPEWGWKPSYPETTGYIMTSLLAYGRRFPQRDVRDAVRRMAQWEVAVQMGSGAVQGGPVCAPERQTAAAFNTGMVLDGWCSTLEAMGGEDVLAAARRAADWLVGDLDERGYFRTNGEFVSRDVIKTYTCLCAWAMHRFGTLSGEAKYRQAAVRAIEAALRQQQPNGWFAANCLARPDAPLTHTIGYTLQGVLEVGAAAGREDFLAAAARCVESLVPCASRDGYLPGCFYADWQPASLSSCLTGSAQVAIAALRLSTLLGRADFAAFGHLLIDYLKPLQALDAADPNVNGALAGSFPIFGDYMRGGYPNWATKYLLDALLLQESSRC
jgi:hypothetical protein